MYNFIAILRLLSIRDRVFKYISVFIHQVYDLFVFIELAYPKLDYKRSFTQPVKLLNARFSKFIQQDKRTLYISYYHSKVIENILSKI